MNLNPTTSAVVRSATDPRAELAAAFATFEDSGRRRLESALAIGRILSDRKRQCGHGNWLKWLETHFAYGRKRAADFIRVWEGRAKCNRAVTFEDALHVLSQPEPAAPQPVAVEDPVADPVPPSEPDANDAGSNVTVQLHLDPEPDPRPADEGAPESEEPGAGAVASDDEPEPAPAPVPSSGGCAPVPSWFKPGNRTDPDHPFADVLNKMTALAAALTRAMGTPQGAKLRDYLLAVQAQKPACPLFVLNRMLTIEGKHYGAQFVGLRGLRRVVRLAGMDGTKRPTTLLKEFAEGEDE